MRQPIRLIAVLAILSAVVGLPRSVAAAALASTGSKASSLNSFVKGEVLVKFNPRYQAQDRANTIAALGNSPLASLNQGWVRVGITPGQSVQQAVAAYRNQAGVVSAQPNYIYHTLAVPNDPQYGQLWAFDNVGQTITSGTTYPPNPGTPGDDIDIQNAWDHITDCSSVVVAVVDSGVNYNQEDLAASMWNGGASYPNHGWDFVDGDNDPMDGHGHGTHVAGIIGAAGNNSLGVAGVCWKASIMAVRAFDATGSGTTANIIQGIDFAVSHGAKVINMSSGAAVPFDQAFSDAITNAQASDVVVVVAAGNSATDNDGGTAEYPCNFTQPNLICVAALDQNYALAFFSNWGATSVDVGAPGQNIVSTYAGTKTTITDNFNTGGKLDWTTSGGGWAYKQVLYGGSPVDALVDPATFPSGTYADSADNRVYKAFDLNGADSAALTFTLQAAVLPGDALNINYSAAGGDPFAGGAQVIGGSVDTGGVGVPFSFDISPCISATCTLGFQLQTDASGTAQGAGIVHFSIDTLTLNNTTYQSETGTSMAAPEVSGLVAMLRAYNPQFTFADVVTAVESGGRPVTALAGKTTTGNAIDVMSSLAHINAPTGLAATVH